MLQFGDAFGLPRKPVMESQGVVDTRDVFLWSGLLDGDFSDEFPPDR
ncbi:hypothetical protein [Streptomyces sp. NPDC002671]